MSFYGYTPIDGAELLWNARSSSVITVAQKDGCMYQLKIYRSAPYPNRETMKPEVYTKKLTRCNALLAYREKINKMLRDADSGDRFFGYATDVFLNNEALYRGVTEAVPYIQGTIAWQEHLRDNKWMYSVFLRAAEAVARLHDLGVVHTDIKPANMLITQDAADVHVTLIDFDKSCLVGYVDLTMGGTAGLQAPELIRLMDNEDDAKLPMLQSAIGSHTDVFALGASFVSMLTGEAPSVKDDKRGVWTVTWKRSVVKQPYMRQLLDAMLAPEAGNRPDAAAVAETLRSKCFTASTDRYALWPEHAKTHAFASGIEKVYRRIACETYNGEHGYTVTYNAGPVRHYCFGQVTNARILVPASKTRAAVGFVPSSSASPDKLSPEDAKRYVVDRDAMALRGWKKIDYRAGQYFLISDGDNGPMKTSAESLAFFGVLKKKEPV